jgi:hypothetical protein
MAQGATIQESTKRRLETKHGLLGHNFPVFPRINHSTINIGANNIIGK